MRKLKDIIFHILFGNPLFRHGIRFGKNSYIREHAIIRRHGGGIRLGHNCKILPYSRIQCIDSKSKILFGDGVFIGYRFSCLCKEKIEIGNHALIASDVFISDSNHSTDKRVGFNTLIAKPVKIGSDCWIGEKVIILPGVTIGEGCIIGAGSVVTKSIPSNSIAVGNPAKVIKKWDQDSNKWIKCSI